MISMKNFIKKISKILILAIIILTLASNPVYAAYKTSFQNSTIQITTPIMNNLSVNKVLSLEGTSRLDQVWFCVRGPAGELSIYPVSVNNQRFKQDIWLRFGPGTYTIWAGDNGKQFDGSIRFEATNNSLDNYRYLAPSGYVNSDNPEVLKIAQSLITPTMTDLQKAKAFHDWVTKNISYDYTSYLAGTNVLNTTLQVIDAKQGLCRDYAFTFASLARSAGIPTKVVYGDALNTTTKTMEKHAWNEAYVDGQWINIDTTWDAGYIKNKLFVQTNSGKYFNTPATTFSITHTVTSDTLF